MPIKAVQQFQLATVLKNEKLAQDTLRHMKESGYNGIELCGFMLRKTSFLIRVLTKMAGMPIGRGGNIDWKRLVDDSGLCVVSIHEDLGSIERDIDLVIKEAQMFRTEYVVVTGMYRFDYGDEEKLHELAKRLNEAGRKLLQSGIHLLYHNHNCEFRKLKGGKTAYQFLMDETNPEYVNFEFDSYWAIEAGVIPLDIMKKLDTRMKLYHINDRGTRINGPSITPILKSDSMELGYGNIDLIPLIEQAKKVNVKAIILEQHRNWIEKSPVKSFQISSRFLNEHLKEVTKSERKY